MTSETHSTKAHLRANLPVLDYRGAIIHERHEMLSLTDMWKAAGSPENREPFNWLRKEGASFVEAVALSHNLTDRQVMTKR
ncbi:hypothetical protein CTI14_00380 [Methylobacterium radiotolerans]|nr:hypothetical protein CTI14_00380 [Methylobacterium radiotolerans]